MGSANLDITASYWESEVLLVVEDAALARAFEAQIDALMAGSTPMTETDPAWQRLAESPRVDASLAGRALCLTAVIVVDQAKPVAPGLHRQKNQCGNDSNGC